jgi:predicted DNA-binding transcriptional regulator YafY
MSTEPRARRCARLLLHLLEFGRITPAEAARVTETTPRAARRDLELLADLLPLRPARWGRQRYWYLDPGFGARNLGVLDRISLLVGKEITSFLQGTALHDGLWRVEDELRDGVSPRYARHFDRKFRHHPEPARSYREQTDLLDDLLDALLRERRVHIVHRPAGGDPGERRDLEPLTLVVYRRALYLLVRRPDGAIRRYAVDRIESLEQGEPFDYPHDWDPDAELGQAFGFFTSGPPERVRLRFTPGVAPYVRARIWHRTQQLHDLPDGGVVLTMHTTGRELVRFALEWGSQCRVLEPAWLVEEVRGELKKAAATYETRGSIPERDQVPAEH